MIGYVGGLLALYFETTIGEFLDVCNPLLGCLAAEIYAGLPIGLVAALASRTWTGLLTLVLGLLATGATIGIVIVLNGATDPAKVMMVAPFYFAFWLGLLGAPAYAVVTGISYVFRWIARAITKG